MKKARTRKTTPVVWRAVAVTTIEAENVDTTKLPPGKRPRQVVVTQLIDDQGRHWERYGADEPVLLRGVPKPKP